MRPKTNRLLMLLIGAMLAGCASQTERSSSGGGAEQAQARRRPPLRRRHRRMSHRAKTCSWWIARSRKHRLRHRPRLQKRPSNPFLIFR